jgi:Ras-related GTP-binding protein C/D
LPVYELKTFRHLKRPERNDSTNDGENHETQEHDEEYDDEEEEEGKSGWWDEEDPNAPWMTQSTRLLPNTTIALWQFTP